jgi:hypothetical protein
MVLMPMEIVSNETSGFLPVGLHNFPCAPLELYGTFPPLGCTPEIGLARINFMETFLEELLIRLCPISPVQPTFLP